MLCCAKPKRAESRKRLRARVSIETASDTPAADGSIARTWGSAVSRWGELQPAGAQPDAHNKVGGHSTYQLFLRGDSVTRALQPAVHRIVYDGRQFEIVRSSLDEDRDVIATVNDYTGQIEADALTYNLTTYDIIPHSQNTTEDESAAGLGDMMAMQVKVRISDFGDGLTAINEEVTLYARTYRIERVIRPAWGDWYLLSLSEEYAN